MRNHIKHYSLGKDDSITIFSHTRKIEIKESNATVLHFLNTLNNPIPIVHPAADPRSPRTSVSEHKNDIPADAVSSGCCGFGGKK